MWFKKKKEVKTLKSGRSRKANGKTAKVLNHLMENGSITSMEAFETYNATRLSAIIFNLRQQGYDILTHETHGSNDSGYTYATYYLIEN